MNIRNVRDYIIVILATVFILTGKGMSQMPMPTPTQTPNLPNSTYNPNWIARDDFEVFPNRGSEPFYYIKSNDNGSGLIAVYSQSHNIGTMSPGSCFSGFCQQGSVLHYVNRLPNGTFVSNYGADVGYYYLQYLGEYSNLAKVTMIAAPPDGAENAGESCPVVGQPVNVTNGNMWLRQTDYVLPGLGEQIQINRFYNSIIQTSGMFGHGWATAYDESLQYFGYNLIRLNMPDGRAVYFVRENSTAPFLPHSPEMYGSIIENTDGTFTLTFKNGFKHHFNSFGSLLWIKDRNGNQTTLNYDTNNVLTGITDASGRTLTINMSGGLVESISDSLGTIAAYTYQPNTANLQTVTYQDGSQYKFEYDTTTVAGKIFLKTVKDANDKILETHEYDSQGRATTSEKEGGVEKYIFDYSTWINPNPNQSYSPHTLVKHKKNAADPNYVETKYFFNKTKGKNFIWKTEGNCNCGSGAEVTTYDFDGKLNLTKKREQITSSLWRETTHTYNYQSDVLTTTDTWGTVTNTYNNYGQVLTTTDRMGGVWTNTYDPSGNLTSIKNPLDKTTILTYPAANNKGLPDSSKDARNNITKFKWFAASGLLQETEDANGKRTNLTYEARGRIKTVTNALNHVTTYNYFDDTQRKVEIIYPNSDKIIYKYDIRRLLESVTDERGKITGYEFDAAYRLKKITDPLGHAKEFDYDLMSNLKLTKDAPGNITDYKYDDFNRLKEIEYPPAVTGATRLKETFEYDKLGRIKKHFDTANRLTEYGYTDATRTNTVTNAELEVTTTKYNQRFQTIEVKDAINQVYNFTYDPLGRQLTQTRAGSTMSYVYDAVGNREKRTDYLGRVTNYTYDKLNRLEKIEYDGGANNPTPDLQATYTYDEISRLKTAANEAGTVSLNYDNRNRIKNTTDVFGHLIEYEYERTSTANQKHLKFDGAMYAVYNFDDASRLANIVNSSDSTTVSFGYDNADRLTSRSFPNNITTTYEYDNMSRLKRLKDVSSTATLFDRQYEYNAANQIEIIAEPTHFRTFGYDNADRLTYLINAQPRPETASPDKAATLPNEDYAYDNVGNRTSSHKSASYGYQPFNKLTSTATTTYKYDANGNMISKSEGSNFWRFNWDYENRLTSASTRKQTVRYIYDALGRRVQRHLVGGKENTKFIYDGLDVLVDDNSGVLTKYLNGEGIDNKLRVQTGSDVKYFLTDHLGSTNGLADSSGNLTASNSYDSFGNATNANFSTRYQFTGREYDTFTGLHYYRARFYDANLGRFISEDPIGFAGGDVNLYGYVWNNPQQFVDPSGHFPILLGRYTRGSLDELQLYLGLAGLVPVIGEPADAVDGAISAARGNYGDAALSGASMLPYAGWGAGITKVCNRLDNFVPKGGVYRLVDPDTGNVMRTGRTNDLQRRRGEHRRNPDLQDFNFESAFRTDDYAEQRGLEDFLYNQYNAPFDKKSPISLKNKNREKYLDAAKNFLKNHD